MSSSKKRPGALYVLIFWLFFLAVSALFGGISLVVDPTGSSLKMGKDVLAGTPFSSYLLPGLILGVLFGIIPLLLIYPLWARPHWRWAKILNIYKHQYWAWTYSLFMGLGVIIWIDVQIYLIGYSQLIQTIIALLGVLIVAFTLWPSVMKYFRRSRRKDTLNDERTPDDL